MIKKTSVIIINTGSPHVGYTIQSVIDWIPRAEIIIVEDELARPNLDLITMFDKADITILDIPTRYPGKLLNEAVKVCTGDLVLIISDRAIITKFFDLGSSYFGEMEKHDMIFGRQFPVKDGKKLLEFAQHWNEYNNKRVENPLYDLNIKFQPDPINYALFNRDMLRTRPFTPMFMMQNLIDEWVLSDLSPVKHLYAPHLMEAQVNI